MHKECNVVTCLSGVNRRCLLGSPHLGLDHQFESLSTAAARIARKALGLCDETEVRFRWSDGHITSVEIAGFPVESVETLEKLSRVLPIGYRLAPKDVTPEEVGPRPPGPPMVQLPGHATDLRANVLAFHAATGQAIQHRPCVPGDEVVRLRAKLIIEECFETLEALLDVDSRTTQDNSIRILMDRVMDRAAVVAVRVNLTALADGLADIAYVTEGAFIAFGIDSRPVHAEVHRTNMAKVGGPMREDGKRMKPPGWTPPDISGIIEQQMWRGHPLVDYALGFHSCCTYAPDIDTPIRVRVNDGAELAGIWNDMPQSQRAELLDYARKLVK